MNLTELKGQIETGAELNRIVNQWRRFNENTRPGSTRPVEYNGHVVPAQMVKEARYKVRRENRRRRELLYDIHPAYDDYEPWEQATALANKNLHPVKVEPTTNPLEVMSMNYLVSDDVYALRYADTLRNVDDSLSYLADAIERFADADPERLRKILENARYDQVLNIDFIYKPEDSADKTPWKDYREGNIKFAGKRSQIITFWERELHDYL